MQSDNLFLRFMSADPSNEMGEDCLFLNVWRPKKDGRFPVMVIVPGGGFGLGTGNMPGYWGDRLAERGNLVVVTFNYRLGMLGFLALPALYSEDSHRTTGNYGLLDQIAALTWVQRNIAQFGGDPTNVTVLGQSAGGWSVCTLLASPKAAGLFHRVIMESGGCGRVQTLEEGFDQGRSFAGQLGCRPEDLECLRRVPAGRVRDQTPLPAWTRFGYGPHVDGHLLTAKPIELMRAGAVNKVPFLAGTNRDELSLQLLAAARDLSNTPASEYAGRLGALFPITEEQTTQLLGAYPLSDFDNQPLKAYQRMATDLTFACPTYDSVLANAALGQPSYHYRFDYTDFRLSRLSGATHGIEIPFVLRSLDRRAFGLFFSNAMAARAQSLSALMQAYWVNFAKTGNPNAVGLPQWSRFDLRTPAVHVLDKTIRDEPFSRDRACAFWREHPLNMGW